MSEKRGFMKKLFISQPMKGKTDEEILRERRCNPFCEENVWRGDRSY